MKALCLSLLLFLLCLMGCKDSISIDIDECIEKAKSIFDGSVEGGVARSYFVESCMADKGYTVIYSCRGGGLPTATKKFTTGCYVKLDQNAVKKEQSPVVNERDFLKEFEREYEKNNKK